jgi:hypothetical protein
MGSGIGAWAIGFVVKDYHTETLGTAITEAVEAIDGARLALIDFQYTNAGTAHLGCFMYAKDFSVALAGSSRNTASAGAAAAQAHVLCTVAPKDPAGNAAANLDIVAYQCTDGSWEFNVVSSLSGSDITMTNNLAKPIAAGAKVMVFGVVGDGSYLQMDLPASVTTTRGEGRIALVHPYIGEPFYFYDANATAAGKLNYMVFAAINK